MMVQLTRLNNQSVMVNSDLIKFVEQAPDTLITLVNGEKFMVRENPEEIVQRIVEYRRSVFQGAVPAWQQVTVQSLSNDLSVGTQSKG
jgi:flagellar protein FlbD